MSIMARVGSTERKETDTRCLGPRLAAQKVQHRHDAGHDAKVARTWRHDRHLDRSNRGQQTLAGLGVMEGISVGAIEGSRHWH